MWHFDPFHAAFFFARLNGGGAFFLPRAVREGATGHGGPLVLLCPVAPTSATAGELNVPFREGLARMNSGRIVVRGRRSSPRSF